MKLIVVLLVIIFSSCENKNHTQKKAEIDSEKTFQISIKPVVDSLYFQKKLALDNIYKDINLDSLYNQNNFENYEISLPFQYSIKLSESSFGFLLGDLDVDPKHSNCNVYRLRNHIKYKGNNYDEGNMYFVKSNDSNALTIKKFKTLNKTAYKKIYYSDNESVIFENSTGNISVLFFKYLKNKKSYVIYYKINENFFVKNSNEDVLDLSINRLRMAKNLFKKNKKIIQPNWAIYKNSLSNLELKKINESFKELMLSIDSLALDSSFRLDSENSLFSIIKMGNQGEKLWKLLGTLPNDSFVDFNTLDYLKINQSINFLRSSSLSNSIKVEFKDSSSLILKRKENSGFGDRNYAIFKKVEIKGSNYLFYNDFTNSISSKEMAYFNLLSLISINT